MSKPLGFGAFFLDHGVDTVKTTAYQEEASKAAAPADPPPPAFSGLATKTSDDNCLAYHDLGPAEDRGGRRKISSRGAA